MPSKKKKYNSRFPPARIKKIMQTDEEIGKVAAAVPVLISKCLEMFLASLLSKAGEVTKSKRAKTMSTSHLKQCIMNESMFDFLKDHVANIPDVQNEDEPSGSFPVERETIPRKAVRKRSLVKVKKTPKKRPKLGHHANNNGSEEETDSADDVSENGSGHEGSDVALSSSFSSPGLLSPSIHSKVEAKSSVGGSQGDFHIPLESLLSDDKIPSSVEINKPPLTIANSDASDHSSQGERKTDTNQKTNLMETETNAHEEFKKENLEHVEETDKTAVLQVVRKGVIVANTAAYLQTTDSASVIRSPGSSTMPSKTLKTLKDSYFDSQNNAQRKNLHMPYHGACMDGKRTETESGCIDQKEESVKRSAADANPVQYDPIYEKGEGSDLRQSIGENSLSQVVPHPPPGGMLSLLYSSVSLPITSIPVPPTVQQSSSLKPTLGTSIVHSLPYTYSPLSQHHLHRPEGHEQRSSVLYHNISPHVDRAPRAQHLHPNLSELSPSIPMSTNSQCSPSHLSYGGVPVPFPYPHAYTPYHHNQAVNPYSSQSHFLGYPRTILTPPSHLSSMSIGSHLAAHPGLSHAKPGKTRTKSDEDDYDA